MTAEERADKVIDAWSPVSKSLYDILVAEFNAHAREAVERELWDLSQWARSMISESPAEDMYTEGYDDGMRDVKRWIDRRLARLGEG